MTNETKQTNWLDQEITQLQSTTFQGEKLPTLKLEPKKITEITIDPKEPFGTYPTTNSAGRPIVKAIIKVKHNKEEKIWWLNKSNPIYREIVQGLKQGKTSFKLLQTGEREQTRYALIE